MAIWLNGREKAFMYSENKLTHEYVHEAVNSMTYQGLQLAAASVLLLCQKIGLSPIETMKMLETGEEKNKCL